VPAQDTPFRFVDEKYLVGLVGLSHAVVVRLDTPGTSCAAAADRVAKACRVLARALPGAGPVAEAAGPPTGTGSGSAGSPAHAVVYLPSAKGNEPREPS
jgi:aminoglycoside phosphotransferase (APT) family kinase protein